jgi:hypothetical protein|tara:strand:- start:307 stop:843 length:537 start_codon:yes stop_codon:yes gene_type:complete
VVDVNNRGGKIRSVQNEGNSVTFQYPDLDELMGNSETAAYKLENPFEEVKLSRVPGIYDVSKPELLELYKLQNLIRDIGTTKENKSNWWGRLNNGKWFTIEYHETDLDVSFEIMEPQTPGQELDFHGGFIHNMKITHKDDLVYDAMVNRYEPHLHQITVWNLQPEWRLAVKQLVNSYQ